jgi:hypothetical protein
MVVLLGSDTEANTADAPPKALMPRKWILRYLNTKFFRFPEGVAVKTRVLREPRPIYRVLPPSLNLKIQLLLPLALTWR